MSQFVEITGHIPVSMNNVSLSARTEVWDLPKCSLFFPFSLSSPSAFSHMTNTSPQCAFKEDTWLENSHHTAREILRDGDLHNIKAYGSNEARGRAGFQTWDHSLTKRQDKSESLLDNNVYCHLVFRIFSQNTFFFFFPCAQYAYWKILLSYAERLISVSYSCQ